MSSIQLLRNNKRLYPEQLINYPATSPILIAADKEAFEYIQRLKGKCLLCDEAYQYESSIFFGREIWILYVEADYLACAMQFARRVQLNGAKKIFVIKTHAGKRWEIHHVK